MDHHPAILTRYLGPTNTRGSRIVATVADSRVTVSYDSAARDPYEIAARKLAEKMGWADRELVKGWLPNGDYVFLAIIK